MPHANPIGRADFTALVAAVRLAVVEAVRPVPELLDATQARQYVGLSKTGWFRAKSAGKLPAPVFVPGSGDRWRKRDLDMWIGKLKGRRGAK